MKPRGAWLFWGTAAAFFALLASHESSRPVVVGRYSPSYFALLVVYALVLGVAAVLARTDRGQRLRELSGELRPQAVMAWSRARYVPLVVAVHLLHLLLVFLYLPPGRVFSGEPILVRDYAHHYHQVSSVVATLAAEGRHWAYDPSFCAGYPLGTLFDLDMKLFEVASYALTRLGLGLAPAFNGLILLCFLAVPLLLWSACRNFALSRGATALVLLTGVLLWHSHWLILTFNGSGMCAFVLATYWTLLVASLFDRLLRDPGAAVYLAFLAALGAGLLVHVTMPVLLAAPLGVLYARRFRRTPFTWHALVWIAVLAAAAANGWWISTVMRFARHRVETLFMAAPTLSDLIGSFLRFESPDLLLALLGLWGYSAIRGEHRAFAVTGLVSVACYWLLANLSRGIPVLGSLEPGRFAIPAAVFAMIGLAAGVASYAQKHAGRVDLRAPVPIVLVLLFFAGATMSPRSMLEPSFRSSEEAFSPITRWVQQHTTREARVAFLDDSPGFLTGARLRFHVDREVIGGPFSQMNLEHSYASFTPYRFFDRRLAELTAEDLARYADLYNIRWLVTSTDEACLTFSLLSPVAVRVDRLTVRGTGRWPSSGSPFARYRQGKGAYGVCFFELNRDADFFLQGSGRVDATLNRIAVEDATPGTVVLKYHWLETLATNPPLPIREHPVAGSPIGFIAVDNGSVRDFVVYNAYRTAG